MTERVLNNLVLFDFNQGIPLSEENRKSLRDTSRYGEFSITFDMLTLLSLYSVDATSNPLERGDEGASIGITTAGYFERVRGYFVNKVNNHNLGYLDKPVRGEEGYRRTLQNLKDKLENYLKDDGNLGVDFGLTYQYENLIKTTI